MCRIHLHRANDWIGALRAYDVYVDGVHAASIRRGKGVDLLVRPGQHTLMCRTGGHYSNPCVVEVSPDEVTYLDVSPAVMSNSSLFAAGLSGGGQTLELRKAQRGGDPAQPRQEAIDCRSIASDRPQEDFTVTVKRQPATRRTIFLALAKGDCGPRPVRHHPAACRGASLPSGPWHGGVDRPGAALWRRADASLAVPLAPAPG